MSDQGSSRFSPEVLEMLYEAGWFPGRDIADMLPLPPGFTPFSVALRVLREFGLLRIGREGSGIKMARCPVILDPMRLAGEDDVLPYLEAKIGSHLYPLGETTYTNCCGLLFIDEQGRVFYNFDGDDLMFEGSSFDEALESMLRGLHAPRWVDDEGHWDPEGHW
jgi:hypothetical protein